MCRITEQIESWMADRANNAIEPGSALAAFAKPLVGFALGEDQLFTFFKTDIGAEFYWTPEEAYAQAFPGEMVQADELSVIAWILPQTEHTRLAHRKVEDLPSIEWSKARHYGEKVNENLRHYIVDTLIDGGYQAFAPTLLPQWSRATSDKYGYASCWSERHAAHACGLGTFGLSDGLITPAGKAIRVGSVIVRKRFTATPRTYAMHNEWCLFLSGGKCLACMKRCPAGAISEAGHDKIKCKDFIRKVTAVHVEQEQLGFKVNSCGLCQTKVPCEARNPVARKKRA
ncbi:MAG: 4Fe-4S ferredoxin [Desulfobulbaceae bacterium]|nr:4Fe-4S ferredoxin [Desulfobulbaceae bacterium]